MNVKRQILFGIACSALLGLLSSAQAQTRQSPAFESMSGTQEINPSHFSFLATLDVTHVGEAAMVWGGVMLSPRFFNYLGMNAGLSIGRLVADNVADYQAIKAPLMIAAMLPFNEQGTLALEANAGITWYPLNGRKGSKTEPIIPTFGGGLRYAAYPSGLAFRVGLEVQRFPRGELLANLMLGLGAAI